jgi:glycosyltransferase involved in cell wall biosynthesis
VNAQPNKMFEYMAAGLPVVASDFPLWRKIIKSAECGLLTDPLNPAAIAEALVWLLRHPARAAQMGRNGRRAVAENYNWERESGSLIATYGELQPA